MFSATVWMLAVAMLCVASALMLWRHAETRRVRTDAKRFIDSRLEPGARGAAPAARPVASTSPRASTLMERVRSPFVTAVATSAIARTWVVRFAASWFTLSVRSFHVPAAPGTLA